MKGEKERRGNGMWKRDEANGCVKKKGGGGREGGGGKETQREERDRFEYGHKWEEEGTIVFP